MLKLSYSKTEFIVFSSKHYVKKTENLHIKMGYRCKKVSASVRNLVLILDSILVIEKQVNATC